MVKLMEPKFSVDQKVVYPSQGVGKITEIFEKTFKENTMLYYKIYIEASDMIVMVPVEKADDLGIRQIVTAEEAQEALNLLSEDFEPITSDWKLRYQMNLDKVKELPILERKLYDSAKKLLEDEISLALGKSEKEISDEIHTKLEPPGSTPKIKHAVILDDDEDDDLMNDLDGSSKGKDSDDDEDDGDDSKSSDSMDSDEDFDDDDSDFE